MQKSKCVDVRNMQEMGSDPGYRVSHMMVAWQTRNVQRQFDHGGKLEHLIQRTSIRSTAVILGSYTFEACISGRFKIVEGSSRSRDVGEVVVLVS